MLHKAENAARGCWAAYPRRAVLLPAVVGLLAFVLLGVVGGVLLSTCWFLLFLSMQLAGSAAPVMQLMQQGVPRRTIMGRAFGAVSVVIGLLGFVAFVGLAANAGATSGPYAVDSSLSCLVALSISLVAASALLAVFGRKKADPSFSDTSAKSLEAASSEPTAAGSGKSLLRSSCCGCCSFCVLVLLCLLFSLAAWHACMKASQTAATAPGTLFRVPDGPAMHVYCEGTDPTLPTVVSLNGIYGSSLDSSWIRRHPSVVSSGVRFCSVDRPGAGWSQPWPAAVDFGMVAQYTKDALLAAKAAGKVGSRLVLLMHSLGGYHGLALAKALEGSTELQVVGAVGADAMSPTWASWQAQRTAADCSPSLATSCATWGECSFWRLVRLAEPSGIVRLLYQGGVGGFDTSIRAFPQDVQATVSRPAPAQALLPFYACPGHAIATPSAQLPC